MRILIVGAGIAGPTLAYWLRKTGHKVTLVERSPQLRRGGYLIDFWGAGFDIADRMGLIPRLMREGYHVRELREVNDTGRTVTSLDPAGLIDSVGNRYVSIARSDLAAAIFDALDGEVKTIFDDTVTALDDDGDRVRVDFERGAPREFDLVIGADGLHSRVRSLAFGPESDFEKCLGIVVAVFDVEGYEPNEQLVAVTHAEVGVQALRFPTRDGATMFCFTFRHDGELPESLDEQHALLRERLGGLGREVPRILDAMPRARTFYLDRASQIRMPSWSKGRVALIGDAAACASLLAGQGSALAMIEAYTLAVELARAGDHRTAFAAYQERLDSFVRGKQKGAIGMGLVFAPRNRIQLFARNVGLRIAGNPCIAKLATRRTIHDSIDLPTL